MKLKMSENTKQVRVDNWGIFFLQRLQLFFSKTDYCDMTLQFEGNVQLKVHRLVMNACTDYFQFLEETCTMENVIMMPADLQSDVIVPIVNFMYTGMLEFHLSIFDRLYKTAQVMNITILTKLLDAQKQTVSSGSKFTKKKASESTPVTYNLPVKKASLKSHSELPAPLPGRKLPVWKRKSAPASSSQILSHSVSPLCFPEPKWNPAIDPLSLPDNTPKPTRFEWPEDDLPSIPLMDTSFEDISYTSKPLLTKDETVRAGTSFDDLKHIPNATPSTSSGKKQSTSSLDMEEMKNYVKEQKIRCGLSTTAEEELVDNDLAPNDSVTSGMKRKLEVKLKQTPSKKVRFEENEKGATISIAGSPNELNHSKIVSEILKKYPQLVKKNKNIRLKIMTKNKSTGVEQTKVESILKSPKVVKPQVSEPPKREPKVVKSREPESRGDDKGPWTCERCSSEEDSMEFVLYYLFRKHMTDVHNEKFDPLLCKYCGHRCHNSNLLMYHLYTKHGMKPPASHNFPKCSLCPFIALSTQRLNKHKMRHSKSEIQCGDCKLAFASAHTLTTHTQITGHNGKSTKNNFDCQYCTKRYTSGVNLFSHVRLQHRNEAIRDGIVSIDENDDMEQYEEEFGEDSSKDEYILPEIMSEPQMGTAGKKVNILQNVKVQDRHEEHTISLEPSSEAEALNNVASGIATSLGLVDIVVLNDNQQLFLQPDQQDFVSQSSEQGEFILPELSGTETAFTQASNDVITSDGVITQSMLSGGDIGSTDELVMVLTDHDYGDNQEEINSENSNIVVLYSHPVDGQQDQFITSQGNIMVNSETGLIEIRNGATITTTTSASQVVMTPQETQIESIEMIQREINSHVDLKSENVYEEDTKPLLDDDAVVVQEIQAETLEDKQPEQQQVDDDEVMPEDSELLENLVQSHDEIENTLNEENGEQEIVDDVMEEEEQLTETPEIDGLPIVSGEEQQGEEQQLPEEVDENVEENTTNVDDFVNMEAHTEKIPEAENESENVMMEVEAEAPVEEETQENEAQNDVTEDTLPDDNQEVEQSAVGCEEDGEIENQVNSEDGATVTETAQTEEDGDKTEESAEPEQTVVMEEDKVVEEPAQEENVTEEIQQTTNEEEVTAFLESSGGNEELSQVPLERPPEYQELAPTGEVTENQLNDENSQSSQDSSRVEVETIDDKFDNQSTKISILDDWEDTDSQQSSEQKENKDKGKEQAGKSVGETVNKLMDDWEEEEEDDGRKEAD